MLRTPRLHPTRVPAVALANLRAHYPDKFDTWTEDDVRAWVEVMPGVIEASGFNAEHAMDEPGLRRTHELAFFHPTDPTDPFGNEYIGCYGVADNIEQVLHRYAPEIADPERVYCISYTVVRREHEQPNGWRWHKWGEYIGVQEPRHEYLYHEEHIEQVICFHIYQLEGPLPIDPFARS